MSNKREFTLSEVWAMLEMEQRATTVRREEIERLTAEKADLLAANKDSMLHYNDCRAELEQRRRSDYSFLGLGNFF